MPSRPYLFYELTNSICSTCYTKVEAKILIQDGRVYLQKYCPVHKIQKVLISTDVEYYQKCRSFLKPSDMPKRFNTPIRYGCPYDCGLCPDHEQHSCLTLLEVTERCNLTCPICYSESSPTAGSFRSLELLEQMLDNIVANEGKPDIVQISGGEPTIHPEFFKILDIAKSKPIRHLMLNTNGILLAKDKSFCERLTRYAPGFEIYLQFDSLHAESLLSLRGEDLRKIRQQALKHLNEFNLSTTLVVTVKKGVNDHELGEIIDFALQQPCVRGVTFQPVQIAGRTEDFNPELNRLTLSEIRSNLLTQTKVFQPADILPVPCHPDCIAMGYALKTPHGVVPLSGLMSPEVLLKESGNSIVYEQNKPLLTKIFELFSTSHSPESSAVSLKDLLCCIPQIPAPESLSYDKVFRVIIMQFLDAYNFDVRSVKKSCVHIAHPDGRIIPFDTYNLFYRESKQSLLNQLKESILI